MAKHLPQVTMIAATSVNIGETVMALKKSLQQITPARTVLFTDIDYVDPDGQIEVVKIAHMGSAEAYSEFIFTQLWHEIVLTSSSHVLVVQHDGYVLDGDAWTDEFLEYDYIGAPWRYQDGRNVGNGGFSLRSKSLHAALQRDVFEIHHPEDEVICRLYRKQLEQEHDIKFAPEELAHKFAYEMHRPIQPTFGFHNLRFNMPYQEPVVIKRTGAMGDVIMMEPVMRYFAEKNYRVIINTLPNYYNLFKQHDYPVEHVAFLSSAEDVSKYRTINLDMAYEVKPKQLVLKSYYEVAGIMDGPLRNPRLNYKYEKKLKLFDDYIVMHIDDTAMAHRNVRGVEWTDVVDWIENNTQYKVFQVGRSDKPGGLKINTIDENFLSYFIAGADLFIGGDSGPSQVAMACGVKSMVFFGSVDPNLRYHDISNMTVMQKACPIKKDGCYHSAVSVKGVDCEVNADRAPCIEFTTSEVIEVLKNLLKS